MKSVNTPFRSSMDKDRKTKLRTPFQKIKFLFTFKTLSFSPKLYYWGVAEHK